MDDETKLEEGFEEEAADAAPAEAAFLPPMNTPVDDALRRACGAVVDDTTDGAPDDPLIVTNAEAGLKGTRQFRFVRWVVAFLVGFSVAGGTCLYAVERGRHGWFDCVFLALNCLTSTGLSSIALDHLRPASQLILGLLMQLGSAVVLSLVPVVLRLRALERALPRCDDPRMLASMLPKRRKFRWCSTSRVADVTFDLDHYRVVPQWLVEYKALVLLVRVVVVYQVVVYLVFFGALNWYVDVTHSAEKLGPGEAGVAVWQWSAFTVVSSFTNCGLTLQAKSFQGFESHGMLLFLVAFCALLGNVLYPAMVRWIVVCLSAAAPRGSNRKIFYRYLLLHGRECYSCLFVSQQTWLLLSMQFGLFALQIAATLMLSWGDEGYRGMWYGRKLGLAAFEAINTRHAGSTALELDKLRGGTLLVQLLNMWLAPVPYVVVLRTTSALLRGNARRATADVRARRSREASREGTPRPSARGPPAGDAPDDLLERFGHGGARSRRSRSSRRRGEARHSRRNHFRGRLLSRALLSREPEPAASPQLRPSLPRADSDFFFARARRRAPTVDGLREEADEDAMVDTRAAKG